MAMDQNEVLLQLDTRFALAPATAVAELQKNELLCADWQADAMMRHSASHAYLKLVWDSRALPKEGEKCMFVARIGHRFNAHTTAEEVLARGHLFVGNPNELRAVSEKERPKGWTDALLANPNFIAVEECEEALRVLLDSASSLRASDFRSIAITGTSGKTSTTQLCGALLERLSAASVMRIGTLGIQAGNRMCEGAYPTMPDYPGFVSALSVARNLKIRDLVFEATSHGLIERRMGRWLCDATVFTNFSQDHLDFHKTMEAYRSCKGILFEEHLKENGQIVLNADDKEWIYFARRAPSHAKAAWGYGLPEHKEPFLNEAKRYFSKIFYLAIEQRGCTHRGISGVWHLDSGDGNFSKEAYELPLLGEFQHHNLAAAVAALLSLGYSLREIASHVKFLRGIPGRLQPVLIDASESYPAVLVDYAHKPDALEKTLLTLRSLKRSPETKLICLFGCGGDRDATKRPVMGRISAELADLTIVTSDNPRTENPEIIIDQIFNGIDEKKRKYVLRESERRRAISLALEHAAANDIVVLAGKGHEDYQIVGTTKRHFSDYEEAEAALRHWMGSTRERIS